MNKLCKQILASMLPYGVTTLCALRMLPLGDYNVSYLYRMVKKLEDDNLLAERRIKTKTDGREYHHRYLALTEAGLYTLAECAGKEDIAVGTMAPGAIGYGFLSYVGKTDHIPKVQTMPNAGILSLLREKEYEALFARVGIASQRLSLVRCRHGGMNSPRWWINPCCIRLHPSGFRPVSFRWW